MKAILFDLDDTLYDQEKILLGAVRDEIERAKELDGGRLFVLMRHYSDEVFTASQKGEITMEDMYVYRISHALSDLGLTISRQEALAFQKRYASRQKNLFLSETMREMLGRLTSVVSLGIITNGPLSHQMDKVKAMGLLSLIPREHIFISGGVGMQKPDPQIFLYAAGQMGLSVSDCVYVGDSPVNDMVGAAAAGMQTVWLDRRGVKLPDGCSPTYVVHDEEELAGILLKISGFSAG